jgi:hypothetical protein
MIKNHLFGYSRFLLTLVLVSTVVLLSGCCSTFCYKDVVYQFDIPSSPSDCPAGTVFRNDLTGGVSHSGGAGIVDRDGGASIVDRKKKKLIKKYCDETQCTASEEATGPMVANWHKSRSNKILIASQKCESKGSN